MNATRFVKNTYIYLRYEPGYDVMGWNGRFTWQKSLPEWCLGTARRRKQVLLSLFLYVAILVLKMNKNHEVETYYDI
jgi:hypothetical protein